ncbi:MAG: tRNA lysidine(34) synthetase TilS [Anaerolineaceae bacterium]|nr:tRNA lysidine(34) synthetase TilS [Anaerolineaceae bacterium]
MDLLAIVQTLAIECCLKKDQPVLLGLSGGPDSLSLLDMMLRCEYLVIAAHLDHKLRKESQEEAEYVRHITEEMGVPFSSGSVDVLTFARENKLSVEEAARKARYQFLFEEARRCKAQAIAVAHTADDQVETVMMHILRGSGMAGLKGMGYRSNKHEWDLKIPIVRPLLGIWRAEILLYCKERNLTPVFDQSNRDMTYFRNRLRHDLLPSLEQYNPKAKQGLWRMSRILEADEAILDGVVEKVWKDCLITQVPQSVTLDHEAIKTLPAGLLRRILRKTISVLLHGERDIGYEVIERGHEFVTNPVGNRVELFAGLNLFLVGERLVVARKEEDIPLGNWPQTQNQTAIELVIPFYYELDSGWALAGSFLSPLPPGERFDNPYQAWLDADRLKFPLVMRPMYAGERFQPLGMSGQTVKLSDYWINKKIPRLARKNWPLLFSREQVIWVPGHQPAHFCKLTEKTERVLHLQLIRP